MEFYLPVTNLFNKFRQNSIKISKILGYGRDHEYIKEVTSKSYFMKLLSDFWSLLGTAISLISIRVSPNYKVLQNYFDEDSTIIEVKLCIMFVADILIFLILNCFFKRFYNLSPWKNYSIVTDKITLGIQCIFFATYVLQDPIVAIVGTIQLC